MNVHCLSAASAGNAFAMTQETLNYNDLVPVCPSCPSRCIWMDYLHGAMRRCLAEDFSTTLNGFPRREGSERRRCLYSEISARIAGGTRGRRRGLPNCVVAGVRGLVYGDGERTGYRNNDDGGEEDEENQNPNDAANQDN